MLGAREAGDWTCGGYGREWGRARGMIVRQAWKWQEAPQALGGSRQSRLSRVVGVYVKGLRTAQRQFHANTPRIQRQMMQSANQLQFKIAL